MKKVILYIGILAFSSLILMSADCKKDDVEDVCLKKEPLIEGTFILSAKIKYKDNVPYTDEVKFKIQKTYCNGTLNGIYTNEGDANSEGYYSTGYIYSYKFENLKDRVEFYFDVDNGPVIKTWYTYFYIDIEAEDAYTVNETINITLDWDSPGK